MQPRHELKVLVNLGENFVEVGVLSKNPSPLDWQRWFLPQTSLTKGFEGFLQKNSWLQPPTFMVTTKLAPKIIGKRLGSMPALLVTSGFENWLDMNIPVQQPYFTLDPSRSRSPINQNFVFGITERLDARGKVLKELPLSELEFLAEKLKLNGITSLAICFLHSDTNPDHEITAAEFFRAKGFKVFSSHNGPQLSEDLQVFKSERHRWWYAFLNAYIYNTFEESHNHLKTQLEALIGQDVQIRYATSDMEFWDFSQLNPLQTSFASETFLAAHLRSQLKQKNLKQATSCYFGLESFFIMDIGKSKSQIWNSEFGPVALPQYELEYFPIQPLTLIEQGFWNSPTFSKQTISFEPGPMCLGKTLNPTFLDVLYLHKDFSEIAGLNEHLQSKAKSRIDEALYAMAKSHTISDELFTMAINSMAATLCRHEQNHIFCHGPLAHLFEEPLKNLLPHKKIINLNDSFSAVKSIAPGGHL